MVDKYVLFFSCMCPDGAVCMTAWVCEWRYTCYMVYYAIISTALLIRRFCKHSDRTCVCVSDILVYKV